MPQGKQNATAFDEILSSFGTQEDRQALEELANKNPKLKEYGLRQDEFSRRLNAVDQDLQELNGWRKWRDDYWDESKQKTRFELEAEQKAARLAQEKADLESRLAGGDVASFDEVQQWLQKEMSEKGVVTRDVLEAEKKAVEALVMGNNAVLGRAALDVPFLNSKHMQEFGEMFRPRDFIQAANEAKAVDLEQFYEQWVGAKRTDRIKSDYEKQLQAEREAKEKAIADAKAEGRREREAESAMGQNGQNPTDMSGPELGAFQKKYLELGNKGDEGSKAPTVPLGEGGVAAYAANQFIQSRQNRS